MKTCRACGLIKPFTDFSRNGRDYPTAAGFKSICKPCQATYMRAYYAANPEKVSKQVDQARRRQRDHPEINLVARAKGRAKKFGIPFNLVPEDLLPLPSTCPVLGVELAYVSHRHDPCSASLDRIDNSIGYIKGNVLVVSYRANTLKGDATVAELCKLADFYRNIERG